MDGVRGVEEETAGFGRPVVFEGLGRFRRIAGIGPAYEMLEDRGEYVHVRVMDSGEEFDYRKSDAESDPAA